MSDQWNRRDLLKHFAAMSAMVALPVRRGTAVPTGADPYLQINVSQVSAHTLRLTVFQQGKALRISPNGSLVQESWGQPIAVQHDRVIDSGNFKIRAAFDPLSLTVSGSNGAKIQ